MVRTQIQFPETLYNDLKSVAEQREWSLAELLRRAAESYLVTVNIGGQKTDEWELPVLRGSGGHHIDPKDVSVEAEALGAKGR